MATKSTTINQDSYPPMPTRPKDIELMLATFSSVIDGRAARYVSSPFTTGRRALEWAAKSRSNGESAEQFRKEVMEHNKATARAYVRTLRNQVNIPVIAPTELPDLDGWVQNDYRYFWGRVIELYATSVTFLDEWQHSSGCAYEFLVAVSSGCETLAQDARPLSQADGVTLLTEAIEERRARGQGTAFLAHVCADLERLDTELRAR